MEIVRGEMGLPVDGYLSDDRLREVYAGRWSGLVHADIEATDPEYNKKRQGDLWNVPHPGGESMAEVYARVKDWFSAMKTDAVVVSHGGVSRCLRGHLLNLSEAEMLSLEVPQNQVLMIEGDTLTWL